MIFFLRNCKVGRWCSKIWRRSSLSGRRRSLTHNKNNNLPFAKDIPVLRILNFYPIVISYALLYCVSWLSCQYNDTTTLGYKFNNKTIPIYVCEGLVYIYRTYFGGSIRLHGPDMYNKSEPYVLARNKLQNITYPIRLFLLLRLTSNLQYNNILVVRRIL